MAIYVTVSCVSHYYPSVDTYKFCFNSQHFISDINLYSLFSAEFAQCQSKGNLYNLSR